uniref:Uncharacterized protein n=1 Tax=Anguilla anguilla TaxID=7936 RepID=A0A0E9R248_ANGAN
MSRIGCLENILLTRLVRNKDLRSYQYEISTTS